MSLPKDIPTSGRVALAVTSVLVAGVVALSLVAYLGVSRRMSADLDRALQREAEAYAAAIGPDASLAGNDLLTVSRAYLQNRTGAESESHPILILHFASGRVLTNSTLPLDQAPENEALLAEPGARRFADVAYKGTTYRVAVIPVRDAAGGVIATYEAALSAEPSRQVAAQLAWTLVGAGMAVVLLGAALSAFVAQGSLRPLRRAARTAGEVTMSSLGRRIPYEGPDDDVGRMVASLNAMLERLESSFAEQRHFVADASHELRTPLAVVRGHLELLESAALSPEERAETLAIVFAEIDRMSRLVDDLLALARLDAAAPPVMQPVDLGTLVAEAAARCRAVLGCGLLRSSAEDVWVAGDPDGLMQAVLNLVRNAEAHTPADGTIALTARREGARAVLEVADTGSGIKPADLPRIFDRFYRAQGKRRSDTGGSGLGLAITKRLVELHGGTISAENGDGGGAVFRVELPAIAAPRDAA